MSITSDLAAKHGVHPARCQHCHREMSERSGFPELLRPGYTDDGPGYCAWECTACGGVTVRTISQVRRMISRAV